MIALDARKIKSSTGRYALELAKNLEEIDHKNRYKIIVLPEEKDYYQPKNPNFEVLAAPFKPYSLSEQTGFNTFLRRLNPDLVHFYMPQQPLLYTKPAVTTVHDLNLVRVKENDMNPAELLIKKRIFAFLLRRVAHRAKQIITPTQFTKDDLVSWAKINPDKVTVTHLGFYKIDKTEAVAKYQSTPFIINLGRAEPYKNNRRLILAHQKLLKDMPDLRLLIAGQIDEFRQADLDWVKQNGYKNVDFLGWLDDAKAAWLYQHALAYVGPSYMEGFGLPALEAMSQGAPLVSADTTCSPEVFGEAAEYFNPFSVDDMAAAIKRVVSDPQRQKELRSLGQKQVKKYSWRRMAEQTLDVYKQILKTSKEG